MSEIRDKISCKEYSCFYYGLSGLITSCNIHSGYAQIIEIILRSSSETSRSYIHLSISTRIFYVILVEPRVG